MNMKSIEVIMRKFPDAKQLSHIENGDLVFDSWECVSHPSQPTDADVSTWKAEHNVTDKAEKQNKSNKKKALLQKLSLSKAELQSLIDLIRDGTDD